MNLVSRTRGQVDLHLYMSKTRKKRPTSERLIYAKYKTIRKTILDPILRYVNYTLNDKC